MKLTVKRGLTTALATVMAYGLLSHDTAQAQTKWPEKQVKMVVPAPPGSAPAQYAAFIKTETANWKDVIIRAKMTPN